MDRVSEDNNLEKSCDASISNATWSSIHLYWTPLLIVLFFSWKIHRRLASHYLYWHMCYRGALELSACPDKMSDIILALSSGKTQSISHKWYWCAVPPHWSSVSRVFFQNGACTPTPNMQNFTCTHVHRHYCCLGGRKSRVHREGLSPSVVQSESKVRH